MLAVGIIAEIWEQAGRQRVPRTSKASKSLTGLLIPARYPTSFIDENQFPGFSTTSCSFQRLPRCKESSYRSNIREGTSPRGKLTLASCNYLFMIIFEHMCALSKVCQLSKSHIDNYPIIHTLKSRYPSTQVRHCLYPTI